MRTRCFARLGHDVAILSADPASVPDLEVLAPSHGHATGLRRALSYVEMVRLLRGWRPDVLVLHFASRPFNWLLPLVWFKPFAASLMGGDILFHQRQELSPRRQRATLRLLDLADVIISPSAYLIDRHPALHPKALVAPWGIELAQFDRPDEAGARRAAARARFGIPDAARVIFSPRRLVPTCGVSGIVDAMPLVRERVPDALLLLLDYEPAAPYRRLLVEAIDRLGIQDRVRWVPPGEYDRMAELYAASDVTVSVARSDGVSQSVLESMASGTPVVLGNLQTYAGLFENGRQCRLVDPQNAASIADGIVELLTSSELRTRVVREARAAVARGADLRQTAIRVEGRLQEIVAAPRRPLRLLARLRHALGLMRLAFERDDAR
jgi:glycosyltransferase involved in cell wall biosynthesis